MSTEAALASIAEAALQLFTSLAKDEFLLLWNSQKELKRLGSTIETISNIHQDTQQRGSEDGSVKQCLAKLRSVLYDAEDLFDGLAFQILHKRNTAGNAFTKEVLLFFSDANQLCVLFKTAHAVKAIRESLDVVKKDMEIYGLIRQQPPLVHNFVRPKPHSFVHDEDVIGRDEDRDQVINMLLPLNKGETSDNRRLSVIAIIGFGGLGKATLAKYVYADKRVKKGFEVHLWARANDLSNLELVLAEIFAPEEGIYFVSLGLEKLQQKLRDLISGRKFLLVLYDVLDENPGNWLKLESFLRCGKTGSRVLVTTRSRKVVDCLDASKPNCCLDLTVLSDESAWSLFVRKAFYGNEEVSEHPELEPLGKKIVRMCGNVPLAIIVVGSLLRHKDKDEKIWSDFLEKCSIAESGDQNEESIKKVLMLSYNDLLPCLKLCFAYCSLFPKYHIFDKDVLVRLWLAQGFIRPSTDNERSLEKEGDEYFFHLVDRCFFQEVHYYERPGVEIETGYVGSHYHKCTVKMHDLIHDMVVDVAKTENLMFDKVTEFKEEKEGLRHIFIVVKVEDSFDYCSLVSDPKTVRTLVLFDWKEQFSQSSFKLLVASFTMLRTLDLSRLAVDCIPESIGGLIHLRYLDLSRNGYLKHLPDSICKLHHLMVLVLENCRNLEKLPQRIENLVSLRQLFIDGCNSLDCLPPGLKALTRLVSLERLIVHRRDGGLRYLEGLDNLAGVLQIELPEEGWFEAIEDAKNSNMARKSKLNEMCIQWKQSDTSSATERKMGKDEAKAVLEALRPHENLEYLRIDMYGGEMLSNWLWMLKNVKELRLARCYNVEYLDDGISGGNLCLPSLKLLWIESMGNLKGWWRPEIAQVTDRPHLSSVSSLYIEGCPKLKGEMPLFEGVENLQLSNVDAELVKELLIPNGSSFSNRVKELHLERIKGLIDLPESWIRHLTALERLNIYECRELRRVSRRGLTHLTALKQLDTGYSEIGDEDDMMGTSRESRMMPWKALQGLEVLKVGVGDIHLLDGLQYLTRLEDLVVLKWIVQIEEGDVELPFKALRNLQTLSIGFSKETIFHLPKSGIQHLGSLLKLTIKDCKESYLGWKTLFSMKLCSLEFTMVERVIDVEYDTMMEPDCLLRKLEFVDCGLQAGLEWMDDIPWIFLSSSLERLYLWGTGERESLPDGIQHLFTLERLYIWRCEKLRLLPVWIPQLTSLKDLYIDGCSAELKRRCEQGKGEDWPLISHLPQTQINDAAYLSW